MVTASCTKKERDDTVLVVHTHFSVDKNTFQGLHNILTTKLDSSKTKI